MNRALNAENITLAAADLGRELQQVRLSSREKTRMVLLAEEILLLYQDHLASSSVFDLQVKKIFGKTQLVIKVEGTAYDYREQQEEAAPLYALIAQNDLIQTWKYQKNCNIIHVVQTGYSQVLDIVRLLIAVFAAALFALFRNHLPAGLDAALTETLVPKIASALGSVLRMFSGAAVFFSIVRCILSFGNMQEVKSVTKTVFVRILFNLTFIVLFAALSFLVFFRMDSSLEALSWNNIFSLFMDMIPPDFISPFINGNMIQISLIALVLGGSMVALNLQNSNLGSSIVSLQQISAQLMAMFCRILPLFVFVNLVSALSTADLTLLLQVLLPLTYGIILAGLIIVIEALEVSLLHHLSAADFFKKALPGTLVCLTTASTAAALPAIRQDLMRIGVEEEDISFLLPLEQAFYKPFTIAIVFPGIMAVYRIFGIQPSLSAQISLMILALIIAVACPPVPGGMLSCFTILCSQLGLPEGSLAVLILISTVMDYFGTCLSGFSIHAEITGIAFRKYRTEKAAVKGK